MDLTNTARANHDDLKIRSKEISIEPIKNPYTNRLKIKSLHEPYVPTYLLDDEKAQARCLEAYPEAEKNVLIQEKHEANHLKPILLTPEQHKLIKTVEKELEAQGLWSDALKEEARGDLFSDSLYDNEEKLARRNEHFLKKHLGEDHQGYKQIETNFAVDHSGFSQNYAIAKAFTYPRLAENPVNQIMRRAPFHYREMIARHMVEGRYFFDNENEVQYFFACFLASRSLTNPEIFQAAISRLREDIFLLCPKENYDWVDFLKDKNFVNKIISRHAKSYFLLVPRLLIHVVEAYKNIEHSEAYGKRRLSEFWSRYEKVWKSLTDKQQETLEDVFMIADPISKVEAAKNFRITVASLNDRIDGAFKKFRLEFQELLRLKRKRSVFSSSKFDLILGGFFRKSKGATLAPLYKLSGENFGTKSLLVPRSGKPQYRQLSDSEMQKLRAWILWTTPDLNLLDTENFTNKIPNY